MLFCDHLGCLRLLGCSSSFAHAFQENKHFAREHPELKLPSSVRCPRPPRIPQDSPVYDVIEMDEEPEDNGLAAGEAELAQALGVGDEESSSDSSVSSWGRHRSSNSSSSSSSSDSSSSQVPRLLRW